MAWIKKVYLYLVSLIALVIIIIGSVTLINMALKQWVFTKADYYPVYNAPCPAPVTGKTVDSSCDPARQAQMEKDNQTAQKQRDAAQALAMIIVGVPVFLYHWKLARREA